MTDMTDFIDKNGDVIDLELTKTLIKELYSNNKYNKSWKDWFDAVNEHLIEDCGNYTLYNDDGYTWLGGPDGMSSIYFQTLDSWIEENDADDIIDVNSYLKGNIIIYKIDDKWITFVACEGD